MFNFLLACGQQVANNAAAAGNGCYDWPVIKQIIIFFGWIIEYIYRFLNLIGIPNIGLVVILFTLLIKLCLLPLTIKQQKFTKLQAFMQPELNAIQAKYKGRKDNASLQAQQDETKAVYAKYGVTQTGGCLQTIIQMPILIALYGALRQLPTVIDALAQPLSKIVDIVFNSGIDATKFGLAEAAATSANATVLYSLPMNGWNDLLTDLSLVSPSAAMQVDALHQNVIGINSFLGFDLSQTAWNLLKGGGIGIIAIILPIIAGGAQWLSFKITQVKNAETNPQDSMQRAATSMGLTMPLFSVFICFTLPASLGIYWAFSSLFQLVLQIFINRHYRKIDMDAFLAENLKKAEEKAKKKREKKGVKGEVITAAANTNTKNIEAPAENSLAAKANVDVAEGTVTKKKPPEGSLAAKAAMVAQYNEEHGEVLTDVEDGKGRRRYKK